MGLSLERFVQSKHKLSLLVHILSSLVMMFISSCASIRQLFAGFIMHIEASRILTVAYFFELPKRNADSN